MKYRHRLNTVTGEEIINGDVIVEEDEKFFLCDDFKEIIDDIENRVNDILREIANANSGNATLGEVQDNIESAYIMLDKLSDDLY